jgi:hypothetical protein
MPESPDNPLGAEVEILRELVRLENAGERSTLAIGPFSAYMMIGLSQLGVRQLAPDDRQGEVFRAIAAQLEPLFAGTGAGDIIESGWNQIETEDNRRR